MKRKNLFSVNKIPYLKNLEYRKNNCILCKVLAGDPEVENLLIYPGEVTSVSLNLYPYNPGHVMVFPNRHLEDIRELTSVEEQHISALTKGCLDMLSEVYLSRSYNVGYNIGPHAGGSIKHLHLHIVPRYPNEVGFIDLLAGAKLIVEEPKQTAEKLTKLIKKYIRPYF